LVHGGNPIFAVWDSELAKFAATCVVTDASLLDGGLCFETDQRCFYNHQCCSHRCRVSVEFTYAGPCLSGALRGCRPPSPQLFCGISC
jgi:hypothetical protein